uniref:Uncharacterized protein n=1 Tax=Sinocyclocheilus rhinocerous TaxID=307959 RepID=A0A673GQH4_9TELE
MTTLASNRIVKQRAVKNTALTKAPITSARIHPYVFLLVARVVSAKLTAIKATTKSDNIARDAVILLTTTSTMKNTSVKDSIHSKRTRFCPKPILDRQTSPLAKLNCKLFRS